MPVHYSIDAARSLIHTVCLEPLLYEDVMRHFRELEADPDLPGRLDVVLDLTEVRSLPDFRQVRSAAGAVERLMRKLRWGKLAVVAPTDGIFGIGRMFETLTERYFEATHVFRGLPEAETWITTRVTDDAPPD